MSDFETRICIFFLLLIFLLGATGCANMPTAYGQWVEVTDGLYKGKRGTMIGECPGFEMYKVYIPMDRRNVCVRSWHMERI